ncbi:MAG TPA: permease-like cell division protein FtsX [Puia sp.]|nr:permease-like cell division protein FtsX [Puia sp.]
MAQFGRGSAKRSKPSYFMVILGVSLVLFFLGMLGWIVINAKRLGQTFRENIEVQVYLRENINPKDSADLLSYIASQPYVKSYEYVTKDLAKKRYLQDGNTDWATVLDKNPLPASINFKIKSDYATVDSLTAITNTLSQNMSVSDVHYNKSLVMNLDSNISKISIVLLIIAVLTSVLVIFLIDNTIRLAMFSNRFLIKTMQMVGATRWFIAKPMDLRALINGLVSGLIAVAGIVAIIFVTEQWIPEVRALRDYTLLGVLFAGMILLGILISFGSTHRSVIKYLKMKLDDLY